MARNSSFSPDEEPLRHLDALKLNTGRVTGPFAFLNPTRAHYDHQGRDEKASREETGPDSSPPDIAYKWTSLSLIHI